MSKLNQMIREFREDIGQSIEGLALLMRMDPDEYARLEEDWIPHDEILQRLCTLFEWNYQDIKRLADQTPSTKANKKKQQDAQSVTAKETSNTVAVTPFAKMVQEARNAARQNEDGIATLLGVSPDYYKEIEAGFVPQDNLLRKLCSLFGWNYKQIQQKINTQSTAILGTKKPPLPVSEIQVKLPKIEIPEIPEVSPGVSLNEQIKQARIDAEQNVEGISLLLQINPEYYQQIESGDAVPNPELLKRISTLFGWNYHELLNREKSTQLSRLQPAVTALDSSDSSITEVKLRETQAKIAENWKNISGDQQQTLLTQLEFIRDSMENFDGGNNNS
jgi:ribosome-binding protein aMBF1 (putative translation factor)